MDQLRKLSRFQLLRAVFIIGFVLMFGVLLSIDRYKEHQQRLELKQQTAQAKELIESFYTEPTFKKLLSSTDANSIRPGNRKLFAIQRALGLNGLTIGPQQQMQVSLQYHLETYSSMLRGPGQQLTIYSIENVHTNILLLSFPTLTTLKSAQYWPILTNLCLSNGISITRLESDSFLVCPLEASSAYKQKPENEKDLLEELRELTFDGLDVDLTGAFKNRAVDLGMHLCEFSQRSGKRIFYVESFENIIQPGGGDSFVLGSASAASVAHYRDILSKALQSKGLAMIEKADRVIIVPLQFSDAYGKHSGEAPLQKAAE